MLVLNCRTSYAEDFLVLRPRIESAKPHLAHDHQGIDEPTWLHHLRRGDYSRWFQDCLKDRYLADQARRVEQRARPRPCEDSYTDSRLDRSAIYPAWV